MPLTGLQRADADHLTRYLLTAFVGDRNDHAIFALFLGHRVLNRSLDPHGRNTLGLGFARIARVEPQVVLTARADARTLQDDRPAVGTDPCGSQGAWTSDAHH